MPRANAHLQHAREYLAEHGETRGGTLANAIGVKQSTLVASIGRAIARGEIKERQDGRAKYYSLGSVAPAEGADEEREEQTQPEVRWTHWDDGDIVIYGLVENEDGSHTIPAHIVQALKNRLAWSPAR